MILLHKKRPQAPKLTYVVDPLNHLIAMAPLTIASRALARGVSKSTPAVRALSTSVSRCDSASSYQSPFKGESKARNIPDFSHYTSKNAGSLNQVFSYFMVGTMGAITAAGAKSTVQGGFNKENSVLGGVFTPGGIDDFHWCQSTGSST